MIVRPKPGVKEVAFAISGSILPRILGRLMLIATLCVIAILIARWHPGLLGQVSSIPFTLIGIALSVFMSFRNNASYDRWWEGRKLWGTLLIACRSFARRASTLEHADRHHLLLGLCGMACGLNARLRNGDEAAAIAAHLGEGPWSNAINPTDTVLQGLGNHCLHLMQDGKIGAIHHQLLEEQLHLMTQVQAGCERIAQTPIPFSYSLLLHRTASIFCLALPFALAGTLGWWTPLPVLLVSYTFFGLDALGDQLEDPFALEPNDLPLDAMTRTIEREMLSTLGGQNLPPSIEARRNILS